MKAYPLSRRALLECLVLATMKRAFASGTDRAVPAREAVDHLLLGVRDLDRGMAWVEERTGVRAVVGGRHPGAGTRNALVSLGGRQYLEILAPDPTQTTYGFPIDVRGLDDPRLVNWAAASSDLEAVGRRIRSAGQETFGPFEGSRARPDGVTLRWRICGVVRPAPTHSVELVPFFIQWAEGTPHPAEDSPGGCRLVGLSFESPNASALKQLLSGLGIDAEVRASELPRMRASLNSPKGPVELS